MNNTIILKKGTCRLTNREFSAFDKGDTIYGNDSNPEELQRWSIEEWKEAHEQLKQYNCSYQQRFNYWNICEFALEFCECDENGDFISGSDYELADYEKDEFADTYALETLEKKDFE